MTAAPTKKGVCSRGSAWGCVRMGREGRGPVVCPPGQRIGLAIGYSPPVDDVVGVGRQSRRPLGMPPGRSAGRAEVF